MEYKLIALDLDGTLTNSEKRITPRTKAALMEAQKRGVRLVLASGRPTFGIMPLAEELELARYGGFILAFNGGKIVDCKTGKTVFEKTLDPALVPTLYHEAMQAGMQILTYKGEGIIATSDKDPYVMEEAHINQMPVLQANAFLNDIVYPINKCLIVGSPAPLHDLELKLSQHLKHDSIALQIISSNVCLWASTRLNLSTNSSTFWASNAKRLSPVVTDITM